jgi:hypothetical protein
MNQTSRHDRQAAQIRQIKEEIERSLGRPARVSPSENRMRIGDGSPELPPFTPAIPRVWRAVGYLLVLLSLIATVAGVLHAL